MRTGTKLPNILISITALVLVVFLTSTFWIGLSPNPISGVWFLVGVSFVSLVVLSVLNLGFALFRSKQRIPHIVSFLLILAIIVWVFPLIAKWHLSTEDRWFLRDGLQKYQLAADKIIQNKAVLTDTRIALVDIFGRPYIPYVYAITNSDGSITIWSHGRGNYSRAGYLYHSGQQPPGSLVDTNRSVHLTNGWYRF